MVCVANTQDAGARMLVDELEDERANEGLAGSRRSLNDSYSVLEGLRQCLALANVQSVELFSNFHLKTTSENVNSEAI